MTKIIFFLDYITDGKKPIFLFTYLPSYSFLFLSRTRILIDLSLVIKEIKNIIHEIQYYKIYPLSIYPVQTNILAKLKSYL